MAPRAWQRQAHPRGTSRDLDSHIPSYLQCSPTTPPPSPPSSSRPSAPFKPPPFFVCQSKGKKTQKNRARLGRITEPQGADATKDPPDHHFPDRERERG